jgi:hypothetical protein
MASKRGGEELTSRPQGYLLKFVRSAVCLPTYDFRGGLLRICRGAAEMKLSDELEHLITLGDLFCEQSFASVLLILYIYIYETCAWTPHHVLLLKIVVKMFAVQIQLGAERGGYSSSIRIRVST